MHPPASEREVVRSHHICFAKQVLEADLSSNYSKDMCSSPHQRRSVTLGGLLASQTAVVETFDCKKQQMALLVSLFAGFSSEHNHASNLITYERIHGFFSLLCVFCVSDLL